MKLKALILLATTMLICVVQARTDDEPENPPTAAERLALLGLIHSLNETGSTKGDDRKRVISFLVAQQYIYWVNIAKMDAQPSWHIENYIAIVIGLLEDEKYFKECLQDPLRGDAREINGVLTPEWQNLGPFMIKSEEQYRMFVTEFNAFLVAVKIDRDRRIKERYNTEEKANKTEQATPRKPSD